MAAPDGSAIIAARAAARKILMGPILPGPPVPADAAGQAYTSARRHVELGWDVAHVLERRIEQRTHQELLRIGQRLVRRPLLGGDHVHTARLEDFAKLFGGKL